MQPSESVPGPGRPALARELVRRGEVAHVLVQIPDPTAYHQRLEQWARGVRLRHLKAVGQEYRGDAWARYEDAKRADHQAEQLRAAAEAEMGHAYSARSEAQRLAANLELPGQAVADGQKYLSDRAADHEHRAAHLNRQHQELKQRAAAYRQAARSALVQIATRAAERAAEEIDRTCKNFIDRWVALFPASAVFSQDVIGPQTVEELANDLEREGMGLLGPVAVERIEAGQAVQYTDDHRVKPVPKPLAPDLGTDDRALPTLVRDITSGTVLSVVGWLDGNPVCRAPGNGRTRYVLETGEWEAYYKGLPDPTKPPEGNGQPLPPVPYYPEWPPQEPDPPHPLLQYQQQQTVPNQWVQDGPPLPINPAGTLVAPDPGMAAYIAQVQGQARQQADYAKAAYEATRAQAGSPGVPYKPGAQQEMLAQARPNNGGVPPGLPPGFRSDDLGNGQVYELGPNDFPQ